MTIQRIIELSNLAFDFDLQDHLNQEGKSIIVLQLINEGERTIEIKLLEGDDPDNMLEDMNAGCPLQASKAGCRPNTHLVFNAEHPRDAFLISNEVLETNDFHIDALIIHELAHYFIESGIPVGIDEEDEEIGEILYAITDQNYEHLTKHNLQFCRTLISGCRRMHNKLQSVLDLTELVQSSMCYDINQEFNLN